MYSKNNYMYIRPPYKDWNPDKIFILPPSKKEDAKKTNYFRCQIQYNYELSDGTEITGPLLIQFLMKRVKVVLVVMV
jgi:hypothetical protein